MRVKSLWSTSVLALVAAAIGAPVAYADVEEIIVTSRKREEALQDVPVAVTAITSEQLANIKPRTLQDLDGLAPNLFIGMNTAGPGASAIYMRGLGYADIEKTQNPAVGVIVDGVFLGTSTGQLIDAFDIQQVEVNRGPQGLVEGKNTTGGTIKVTRSRPTMEWGFKGSASYGNYDELVLRGVVNVPLVENVAGFKLGYTYRNRDGYYDNVYGGPSNGDVEYTGINSALLVQPTDNFEALVVFDYIADRSEGNPVQYGNLLTSQVTGIAVGTQTASPAGLGVLEVLNDRPERSYLDMLRGSVELGWTTDFGKITSITGYLRSKDFVLQDFDGTCNTELGGTPCPPAGVNIFLVSGANPLGTLHTNRDQDYEQITQEIRLDADITDTLSIQAGVFYYEHEINLVQITNGAVLQQSNEKNDSLSFFGAASWDITDRININGGARWISEDKNFDSQFGLTSAPGVIVPRFEDDDSWEDLVTKIGVDFKVTPDHLLYFSRSEGFRSGGFSIRGTLSEQIEGQPNCAPDNGNGTPLELLCPENNFLSYDPEEVTAYEIGSKNTFLDGQIVANLAGYIMKLEGQQVSSIVVTPGYGPGTNTYINNYQETKYKGIEAELTFRPDFLPGFTLAASGGFQDAEVKEALVDARRAPQAGAPIAGVTGQRDFAGIPLTRVADYNYSLSGTHELSIGTGMLRTNVSWRYIDDFALTTQAGFGSGADIQEGYGLLDASVTYEWNNVAFSVFGKNLLDKEYRNHSLPTVYFQGWGNPLTVAGEVSVNF